MIRKYFPTTSDALVFARKRGIRLGDIVYIADRGGVCELVYAVRNAR